MIEKKEESGETSRRELLAGEAAVALPESRGYIVFDPELCTGCQTCELACSAFHNDGKTQPALARLQVIRNPFGGTIHNFEPKVCLQCQNPVCMPVCPVEGAMYIDEKTGARCIDETKCNACNGDKRCIEACGNYYDPPRIMFDLERSVAIKCDLCGGDPQCVTWCSNRALKYITLSELKETGSYQQDFYEPYTKNFGPHYTSYQGYKVTFKKAYPYLAGQEQERM